MGLLLASGAEVNARTSGEHATALQIAVSQQDEKLVQFLLESGADVNITGGYYCSALQEAAWLRDKEIVELLFKSGAQVNVIGGK